MEFTIQHFIALAPLLITSLTIVVVMLSIAWRRNHAQTFLLSCAGLNLALLSIIPALKVAPLAVTPLMIFSPPFRLPCVRSLKQSTASSSPKLQTQSSTTST